MKTSTYLFASALLLSISTSAFAQSPTPTPDMMSLLGRGDFCTTIKSIDTTSLTLPFGQPMPLMGQLDQKIAKKENIFQKVADKFRGKSDKKESKLAEKSDNKSDHLTKKFESLRSIAKTDTEKAAVEKFITAVTTAENTKKAALDPIMAQYKKDMEALITTKSGISADVIAKNKAAIESAVASAKSACASGTSSADAKTAFKKAIESTMASFRDFKPSAELRREMKALERKNRDAIQKINDAFRDAMDDARDALELAMPNAVPTQNNKSGFGQGNSEFGHKQGQKGHGNR